MDRKQRNKAKEDAEIVRAESNLLTLIESFLDGILIVNADGRIVFLNRAIETLFGYRRDELVGEMVEILIPEAERAQHPQLRDAFLRAPQARPMAQRRDLLARRKDGSTFSVEVGLNPFLVGDRLHVVATVLDVTEKKRIERARLQAEQENAAKTEFLASMSHEIRTPLNGILGYNELLLGSLLNREQRRYAEQIESAALALLTVINDVLQLSRIEAGRLALDSQPFSLVRLVDETLSIIRPIADKKNLPVRLELDPEIPDLVLGDAARLRQVLLNLLDNAVKFTEKGHVLLSVQHLGSSDRTVRFRMAVSDTGIGIPKEKQSGLFERYSQVYPVDKGTFGGTGLGLAISRKLVELMGGTITVESEAGRGATFVIEIELPRAEREHKQVKGTSPIASHSARILLVDDLRMNQEIAATMLTDAGFQVHVVDNGEAAVAAAQQGEFQLILMDIQMDGMDGLTATKLIRALPPPASELPIIAMTANVLPQQVRMFKQAGMNDHLAKPFTRQELIRVVEDNISGKDTCQSFEEDAIRRLLELIGERRVSEWRDEMQLNLRHFLELQNRRPTDATEIAALSHRLIPSAANFGLRELARRCQEIEDAYRENRDLSDKLEHAQAAAKDAVCWLEERRL